MAVEAFAPAKINLALHVTGQRADGYHLLDSLVVFADAGDRLNVEAAPRLSLRVTGPRAEGVPADGANLVLRAAEWLAPGRGAAITLDKRLPMAAGIGGGSSDAAAAIRALCELWGQALPTAERLAALGADVPVCLGARSARMAGIGERLAPVPALPPLSLVLVNPGVAVSTPEVFARLERRDGPPLPALPCWRDAEDLAGWLEGTRNDLEEPACALVPAISEALGALRAMPGCLLARMSGSGATCFGLFAEAGAAARARDRLRSEREWWVEDCGLYAAQATRATT